jgi:hypothetical protein
LEGVILVLALYALVMIPAALFYRTFIPYLLFSFLLFITPLVFLTMTYGWSIMCGALIPPLIIDDVFEFIVYNLFPKCDYFFGGLIKGPYTNDNCYSCNNVKNFTYYDCQKDIGIGDFLDNVIMLLEWRASFILDFIRDTRIPGIYDLFYGSAFARNRIDKFKNVDFSSPEELPACLTCQMITFFPNLVIFILIAAILLVLGITSISLAYAIISPLISLIFAMVMMIYYIQLSISMEFISSFEEKQQLGENQEPSFNRTSGRNNMHTDTAADRQTPNISSSQLINTNGNLRVRPISHLSNIRD